MTGVYELNDAELDAVCGGCRHHGWGHHGWGHFGHLWGAGHLNQLGGFFNHSFNTVTQTIVQIGVVIGGGSVTQLGSNTSNI